MLGKNKMNKIIALGTAFLLGAGAGLVIQSKDWPSFLTSYIPALATLVAAYYGAKYAFQFQNDKELIAEKNHNIVSANAAIFTLSRMANKLFNYRRDVITPVLNKTSAFIEMQPTLDMEKEHIKLNIEALYFLLQTSDKNILGEVMVEEERYRSAIEAINKRSQLHLQEMQPVLEKAGFVEGGNYTLEQFEKILGNRLYITMQEATEQVITHVDSTITSLKQTADKLTTIIKEQYPNETVIRFVLPNT